MTLGEVVPEAPPKSQGHVAMLATVHARLGGISQYFGGLLLGGALGAALLWPHLMVWKVFLPRYVLGVRLTCFAWTSWYWLGCSSVLAAW